MAQDKLAIDDLCKELAKTELGENPATKLQQIEAIRKWIVTHNYLECRTDDEFILRFLRVSKFSCEAAKERIEKYCIGRSSKLDGMPEWFESGGLDDPEIRSILEKGIIYPLPEPDANGRVIIVTDYGAAGKANPASCGAAAFLMFDYILAKYPRTQINGIRMVENAAGYNKEQMMYWNLERVPKAVNIIQGAYPFRVKSLDWYNLPAFARVVMEAGMLVMKNKLRERVHIHAKYEPAKDIPSHVMPPLFAGEGPKWEDMKEIILNDMDNYRSEYEMLKMCKINEAKRPKKVYQGDSWGISGTYISTGAE